MKRLTIAAFGVLLTTLVASGFGCELITAPDRTLIDNKGGGGSGGVPTGGGGTGGTPTGGGGTGGSMKCETPADCMAPAEECLEATCTQGVCGTAPKAQGSAVQDQTAGDCKLNQCDGAGAVESVADNTDLPNDNEECTEDVCNAGAPENNPLPAESPCGTGGALFCNGAGQCVNCTQAAQCGTDTECQQHTCDNGVCDVVNTAAGTALSMQTAGDCQVVQCDGTGSEESAEDNSDVPVDTTVCTDDVCAAGVPSNPPVPANTACMEGTGVLCDGNGACAECVVDADCPGVNDECQTKKCTLGVCGFDFAPNGTLVAAQTAGDCKANVCDGAGTVIIANADTDLPNDNETCTTDTCVGGVETFTPVMAGATCGAAGVCNAAGQCVGCNTENDCPGVNDECKTKTCTNNVCGFNFTANGTAVTSQTAGNCQQNVCDGSGNTVSVTDNADVPADDGNQCTSQTCTNGSPAFPPVAVDTTCNQNGGSFCSAAGTCVACNVGTQCPGSDTECQTRTCVSNACGFNFQPNGFVVPTQSTGDCTVNQCNGSGGIVQANANSDVPVDGLECTGDVCTNGVPSNPPVAVDTPCTQNGGSFCSAGGQCVQCNAATQCPGTDTECQTRTCASNTCGFNFTTAGTPVASQTAGDCKRNECNGSGGIVANNFNSDVPVDGVQCTSDVCTNGVPSNPPVAVDTPCTQNGGSFCSAAGACVQCNAATQCPGTDTECQTRTCAGNTCGFNFTAAGTPVASQTTGDCKRNECNGSGAIVANNFDSDVPADGNQCTGDVCTSGVPSNPNLMAGTTCNQNGGTNCDGAGQCVTAACSDGIKNGTETDTDCGGSCGSTCDNGETCSVNADCVSNICNGGVCVQCVTASQCPGTDNECQTRTCTSNTCGFNFTAAGTPVASQTAGDCKRNECNGSGAIVANNFDTDLPVDGNQCTSDVCTSGVPSNLPVAVDTACSQNGGTVCNATGTCVACNAASQCPGTDTECQTRTCTSNTCGFNFTAAGTPVASQTTGDCKRNECNGSGAIVANNFDTDLPVDGNQCTSDVCTSGVPSNPPAAIDTACSQNGGSFCNATGTCVACNTGTQCPGTDTECQTRTCTSNTCGFNFTAAGTPVASQTTGDCKRNECNGSGAIVANNFDTDLPVDGNQCTDDVCTSGVPSNPPVAIDTACSQNGGSFCNAAGTCVACNAASQCPGTDTECQTRTCTSNTCGFDFTTAGTPVMSQTTGDCKRNECNGSGAIVANNFDTDLPVDGNECTGDVCTSGVPTNPALPLNTACNQNGGTVCDGVGACVVPPTVTGHSPADAAGNVLTPTAVAVTFSTAMNPATLQGQTTAGACSGSIQVSLDNFATCVPFAQAQAVMTGGNTTGALLPFPALEVGKVYKIRVTTTAASAIGIPLAAVYTSASGFTTATLPATCVSGVVISQVYGAGGNIGAPYKNDFIELYNGGTTAVDVSTWAVHYASSTGTSWTKTNLTGSIPPGGYYQVRQAGGANGLDLPTADATGGATMSATAGKVVLTNNQTNLGTISCPSGAAVVDIVGFGTGTNCFEGTGPTPAPSAINSVSRKGYGCTDANDNAVDFVSSAVNPRNTQHRISANESGAAVEMDYCVLQFPNTFTVAPNTVTPTIYARVYEAALTPAAGANALIGAQIGYGPVGTNPEVQGHWIWTNATFNVQVGNDDEYQATFTSPATAGTYRYAARFTQSNGAWTYCDINASPGGDTGAGANAGLDFQTTNMGTMTVQ
ncbi:MAG: lamin tail domain-containing protein [Polyangiaceae bacterium]|nr:lamin tail domain-containing protein [Polyangiaceae bacterium]